MQTELFSVLREKIGANNLNSLIEEKVFPVAGDISFEDFGIENSDMKNKMFKEIDIIINSAATTRFDERYIFFSYDLILMQNINLIFFN